MAGRGGIGQALWVEHGILAVHSHPVPDLAKEMLRKAFGFEEFLDGQAGIVENILGSQDGLVVMPTGGGKSLCYQLPALCLDGVTVVVSTSTSHMILCMLEVAVASDGECECAERGGGQSTPHTGRC